MRTSPPVGYEPNYPYLLLVFLHGHSLQRGAILRLAPRLSRRNYICIAPRPHISSRGPTARALQLGAGRRTTRWSRSTFPRDRADRRSYHIHSERIYLAGFREGAAVAYRLGMVYPDRSPASSRSTADAETRRAAAAIPEVRKLRVFIGHGFANAIVPLAQAKQDHRLFYSAGLNVKLHTYPSTHRIHAEMLRDVDRWVQDTSSRTTTPCRNNPSGLDEPPTPPGVPSLRRRSALGGWEKGKSHPREVCPAPMRVYRLLR